MSRCRVVGLLLSEGVAIDQLTSRLTIFNELGTLFAQGAPARLSRLVAVVFYELGEEPETFDERLRVVSPEGEPLHESLSHLELPERSEAILSHRSVHSLWQIVLPTHGTYRVTLERRSSPEDTWEEIAERRVGVLPVPHPMFR